jgi:hypothetical protein
VTAAEPDRLALALDVEDPEPAMILRFRFATTPRGYLVAHCPEHNISAIVCTLKKSLDWKWSILMIRTRDAIERALRSPRGDKVVACQVGNPEAIGAPHPVFVAMPLRTARAGLERIRNEHH